MLIKTVHTKALLDLLANSGKTKLPQQTGYVLELQGLVQPITDEEYALTYMGHRLAVLLKDMLDSGVLLPLEQWKESSQFVDSRVITALMSAHFNSGRVGPIGAQVLVKRGFAQEQENGKFILTEYGEVLYDIYSKIDFRVRIDNDLWQYIRRLPEGPGLSSRINFDDMQIEKLEAMGLLSFSLPKGGVFAFTLLGKKIKELVNYTVAWDNVSIVFDDDIVWLYKQVQLGGVDSLGEKERDLLEALGYLKHGEPTPAWEIVGQIIDILERRFRYRVRTFDIELPEVYLLDTIDKIWDKHRTNLDEIPTKERLYTETFVKPRKEYKELVAFYGRRLHEELGAGKREEIEKRFKEFDTLEEVFMSFYKTAGKTETRLMEIMSDMLFSLESFGLIVTTQFNGKRVYQLTKHGKAVLEEMRGAGFQEIKSQAVKTITISANEVVAPTNEWFEAALEAGLVSELGITDRGRFYKDLAYKVARLPFLTALETEVFRKVPLDGSTKDEVLSNLDHLDREAVEYAIGKLEARGFVRILPDGGIMLTNRGKLLGQALAGARTKHPINPLVIRVLKALSQIGTLYVKEHKSKKVPEELKKAVRLSGLDEETFMDALIVARASGFVGSNGISEQGQALLDLLKRL